MPIEKIGSLKLEAIKSARTQLERVVASLLAAEKILEAKKLDELWVFRLTSLEHALERSRAFNAELQRAFDAVMSGMPQGPEAKKAGRPKTKGTKKK